MAGLNARRAILGGARDRLVNTRRRPTSIDEQL